MGSENFVYRSEFNTPKFDSMPNFINIFSDEKNLKKQKGPPFELKYHLNSTNSNIEPPPLPSKLCSEDDMSEMYMAHPTLKVFWGQKTFAMYGARKNMAHTIVLRNI